MVKIMYESPINLIYGGLTTKITEDIDNAILTVIQKLDIDVDKEELIKALNYDRDQYRKGYMDELKKATENYLKGETE